MDEREWLADEFETHRPALRAFAQRMLGGWAEADDAVQEAWLRLSRAGPEGVENLDGFLRTVVARVCLDMLRARKARREEPLPESPAAGAEGRAADPEQEAVLADAAAGAALLVLDRLAPGERVCFVLHDLFGVPFEEVAGVVGRTPAAARQMASRGRRRLRGEAPPGGVERARRRRLVDTFLAASRAGDLAGLVALLAPDAVLRADPVAVASAWARHAHGAPPLAPEVRGAEAVASVFSGRARGAAPALVEGAPGAVWAPGGRPRAVFRFGVADGRIVSVDVVADPEVVARTAVALDPA